MVFLTYNKQKRVWMYLIACKKGIVVFVALCFLYLTRMHMWLAL